MSNLIHSIVSSRTATGARLTLGLIFTVFGLNGFFQFLPQPPVPEAAGVFLGALAATGYMFPLIKATEVVAGVMLLSNRFVPLALLLLAPVVVNIVAFHAALAPEGMFVPLLVLTLELGLAWHYREVLGVVLTPRAPRAAVPSDEAISTASPSAA